LTLIAIFVALIFVYSLVSARLEKSVVTAPILFTTAGILVCAFGVELHVDGGGIGALLTVAELGLVLLLFTDASRTDVSILRHARARPTRLLSVGMLLTLVLGAAAAWAVFPGMSLFEAGILSAILAPTDAGLGQIIVSSPRVPMKIRQALNVEAGLNDGLSVPFLLFFMAMASNGHARLGRFVVEQLGYGVLVGVGLGLAGGLLVGRAKQSKWMAESSTQLGLVAIPLLGALACEAIGASMFIAAFVAGLFVQRGFKNAGRHSVEFTDQWGQTLNLSVFFLFGILVARDFHGFAPRHLVYAFLSLTVVRMLPVAISLIGTRLSRATVLFMGWFGPRGLASIVLGLVYLEEKTHLPDEPTIRLTVMVTVLASIFAHGLSAMPGINLYATRIAALPASAPEREGVAQ
jgi:NhaP-type Na+/H+ or K+/H+ antiporter